MKETIARIGKGKVLTVVGLFLALTNQVTAVDSDVLYEIRKAGRGGYMDYSGMVVVEPKYQSVKPFSDGMGVISDTDIGILLFDATGKQRALLAGPDVVAVDQFSEGLAAYTVNGPFGRGVRGGFVDKDGKIVIKPTFYTTSAFSEGLAVVKIREGELGYCDKTGKVVIPGPFLDAQRFSEGLAVAKKDGLFGYIDKQGNWVVPPRYAAAKDFKEGLAHVYTSTGARTGKISFIDREGKVIFELGEGVRCLNFFSDGLVGSTRGNKFGYLDKKGRFAIEPTFDSGAEFTEGLAGVKVGTLWGCIDKTGKMVIQPQFPSPPRFVNGVGRISVSPKIGYIDMTGKWIWPLSE